MPKANDTRTDELAQQTTSDAALAQINEQIGQLSEALEANVGNTPLGFFDLDRIKVPSGGATMWGYEGPEGVIGSEEIVGVMLSVQKARSYFEATEAKEGTPPDCASTDGDHGYGTRGFPQDAGGPYDCATCPFAQWGSATGADGKERRGKRCREREFVLFLIPTAGALPYFLNLPPSSIDVSKKYRLRVAKRLGRFWHVVTKLTLEKVTGDFTHSRVVMTQVGNLDADQCAQVDALKRVVDGILQTVKPADVYEAGPTPEAAPPAVPPVPDPDTDSDAPE